MMYQVSYNKTTRVALVQADAAAVPGGSVDVGSFEHADATNPDSVVIYHGIRDLLSKRSFVNPAVAATFPENITDMQNITIAFDAGLTSADFVVVSSVNMTPATASIAVAATVQLNVAVTPSNATKEGVGYVSSNPAVATVSATGLVTGVAVGTATITATDETGRFSDTSAITVTV